MVENSDSEASCSCDQTSSDTSYEEYLFEDCDPVGNDESVEKTDGDNPNVASSSSPTTITDEILASAVSTTKDVMDKSRSEISESDDIRSKMLFDDSSSIEKDKIMLVEDTADDISSHRNENKADYLAEIYGNGQVGDSYSFVEDPDDTKHHEAAPSLEKSLENSRQNLLLKIATKALCIPASLNSMSLASNKILPPHSLAKMIRNSRQRLLLKVVTKAFCIPASPKWESMRRAKKRN